MIVRTNPLRRSLWCVAFGCLCIATLFAQSQSPTFRTDANYVRVDVYASRNGNPVLDLGRDDFELAEDQVPQKIEQFEHVTVASSVGQAALPQPATVAGSRQAAADPRARVFVVFLDLPHVDAGASRQFRQPLIAMLSKLVGERDLVAVMTADLKPSALTFAYGPRQVEQMLAGAWWGERDRLDFRDETERSYTACYPGIPKAGAYVALDAGIAQEMILRRREQQTLDALIELMRVLHGVREERKAVLMVSDGWLLYRPNAALDRPLDRGVPQSAEIAVDPRTGQLTTTGNGEGRLTSKCEADRLELSQLNDQPRFRQLIDEANRANASFYPLDPRGLTAFDDDIVPAAGVGFGPLANPTTAPSDDAANLGARGSSLRGVAEATDGVALVGTNRPAPVVQRIVNDLSSYYLLGYYSTGRLDGKFHAISVRSKRAGIEVRARGGYLALSAATVQPASSVAPLIGSTQAVAAAIGALTTSARDTPLHIRSVSAWGTNGLPTVWAVVELGQSGRSAGAPSPAPAREDQIDALLVTAAGETVSSGRAAVPSGVTSVRIAITAPRVEPGEYQLQARLRSTASSEALKVQILPAPRSSGTLLTHRGPATANREVPAADPRFRRSERLRVEMPAAGDVISSRVLDRTGAPVAIPVTPAVRDEPDGSRWATTEIALAPLAPGDYIVELTSGSEQTLTAFRVVP